MLVIFDVRQARRLRSRSTIHTPATRKREVKRKARSTRSVSLYYFYGGDRGGGAGAEREGKSKAGEWKRVATASVTHALTSGRVDKRGIAPRVRRTKSNPPSINYQVSERTRRKDTYLRYATLLHVNEFSEV